MTRINLVPVEELCNKHLVAEYRELPRISKAAKHITDAPSSYVLGKGHCKFFYDKGLFLQKRFAQLVAEMNKRGFTTNFTEYRQHPDGLNNDYVPSDNEIEINRQRIKERLEVMSEKRS